MSKNMVASALAMLAVWLFAVYTIIKVPTPTTFVFVFILVVAHLYQTVYVGVNADYWELRYRNRL